MSKLIEFIEGDFLKTLFPLKSTLILYKFGEQEIRNYIYQDIFGDKNGKGQGGNNTNNYFLTQPFVYAAKNRFHVRQAFLLDPVSLFFLYDFVYNTSSFFSKEEDNSRMKFGYSFSDKKPNSASEEYKLFREKIYELKRQYMYIGFIDIANCFNNLYHHDLKSFISSKIGEEEGNRFGRFLREINEGRSTSCMPQGNFPIKAIGNSFLSFIEQSRELQSEHIVRFMDDIYLFSDREELILEDIYIIQRLIGEKGLALNEEKTYIDESHIEQEEIEQIKINLLEKRRNKINAYEDFLEDDDYIIELDDDEVEYLKDLLKNKNHISDEDIELILSLLVNNPEETYNLVELVLNNAPHLTKALYHNLNKNDYVLTNILDLIIELIKTEHIQEFQLFWVTKIIIDLYPIDDKVAKLLFNIYYHRSSTNVVRCIILETMEINYGFLELKQSITRGNAPELVISAIVGLLKHEKSIRNHIYGYVGKSSKLMSVITGILKKINPTEVEKYYSVKYKEMQTIEIMSPVEAYNPFNSSAFIDISDDDLPF